MYKIFNLRFHINKYFYVLYQVLSFTGVAIQFLPIRPGQLVNARVSADKVSGQWDIALRDLDFAISLDANDDSVITWKELRNKYEAITTEEYRNCSNRGSVYDAPA